MRNLLLSGILAAVCCSIGNAQIIYSNAFNGGAVNINGMSPTVAANYAGGSSSATWSDALGIHDTNSSGAVFFGANGAVPGTPNSLLLPFTPQPGYIYTLTATATWTGDPGSWVGLGFAQNDSADVPYGYGRLSDSGNGGPNGYDWLIGGAGRGEQWFEGPRGFPTAGLASGSVMPSDGTYTWQLTLDTSSLKWVISCFINGAQFGTSFTYTNNVAIGAVGITETTLSNPGAIQWSNIVLTAVAKPITNNTYWVAPTATGAGDGSSSANAANFLDYGFWNGIQDLLQVTNVTVNLNDGNYYQGMLGFTNMGNAVHRLTLQAVDPNQAVFTANLGTLLYITGSQNIKFSGLTFTGPAQYWGVYCIPNGIYPCRNLEFSYCQFTNLTSVYYAAIGLLNGTRDILVDNCSFANLTASNGNHQHMIYASHDIVGVVATNCSFQDCYADYLRFRDDSEYCVIENCTFTSTTSASVWPFISAELFNETNSDSAGDEFFGTYFQVSSNAFNYNASGGVGPRSALHFSNTGYSPQSYDCDLTSAQAAQLANGTVSFQQSFLQTNMGIIASVIKMFGNTYNSRVAHAVDYTYNWDGVQPNGGWSGTVDISSAPNSSGALLGPIPALRNGNFDKQGLLLTSIKAGLKDNECLFRDWFCNPQYTAILSHSGFDGTSNALMFNKAATQYVYQWITPPGPTWTMDFLFAMDSAFTGTGVKFKVDIFHDDVLGGKISVGVNDQGQFGIFNNTAFIPLSTLGTVSISTNNVYHIRIVGNYSAAKPYVNIYTSDANNPALTHQSLGLTYWVGSTPVSGQSSPETVAFYNYANTVIVDQVALSAGLGEQPPVITSSALQNNGQFILSGTNGFAGDNYYLYSSTNLASGHWTLEGSNSFDANGNFSITNTVTPGTPQKFYRLQLQ